MLGYAGFAAGPAARTAGSGSGSYSCGRWGVFTIDAGTHTEGTQAESNCAGVGRK